MILLPGGIQDLCSAVPSALSRPFPRRLVRREVRAVRGKESLHAGPPFLAVTSHPGLPGTEGVPGMWDFVAKNQKVSGKPGHVGPLIAFQ